MSTGSLKAAALTASLLTASLLTASPATAFSSPCEVENAQACESAELYGEPACTYVEATTYERNGEQIERSGYCRARPIVGVVETLTRKGVLSPESENR